MPTIKAKRVRLILKSGRVELYTHVIYFTISMAHEPDTPMKPIPMLIITGETDVAGGRANMTRQWPIETLLTMDVEFYIPVV